MFQEKKIMKQLIVKWINLLKKKIIYYLTFYQILHANEFGFNAELLQVRYIFQRAESHRINLSRSQTAAIVAVQPRRKI